MTIINKNLEVNFSINLKFFHLIGKLLAKNVVGILILALSIISVVSFIHFYSNGLSLAYNDARSHLNIGRRVVEGLKPGIAQLGSVWLPLSHVLMIPTIWNDFMWHSGLSGSIQSMISFVVVGVLIYLYLKELGVSMLGRLFGVLVFVLNINVLYLQSTAMTELLLLATMTAGSYHLMKWLKYDNILHLIKAAFWIMLSTLTRYDGWFLLFFASLLVTFVTLRRKGYKTTEGTYILFGTLAGLGVVMWLAWNLLIFRDPLYFALGPFSAKAQQDQIEKAGMLITKHNWFQSFKFYFYALVYNSGFVNVFYGICGFLFLLWDKRLKINTRLATTMLIAPLLFNILALYLGHSVLFIQGLSGNIWFNVRYGVMLMPSLAIFAGYLLDRARGARLALVGFFVFFSFFTFYSSDAVTIDDATVGSSQKNVSEVSGWLKEHAKDEKGFVLISAASHDAIIFSSGLPMKRFIHEGTGLYWENALAFPDRWARWIILRTNDDSDLTFRFVKKAPGFERYNKVGSYPFADIYELKPEYLSELNTEPILGRQK